MSEITIFCFYKTFLQFCWAKFLSDHLYHISCESFSSVVYFRGCTALILTLAWMSDYSWNADCLNFWLLIGKLMGKLTVVTMESWTFMFSSDVCLKREGVLVNQNDPWGTQKRWYEWNMTERQKGETDWRLEFGIVAHKKPSQVV